MLHHSSLGRPEEPEHVTFGDSPLRVTALFWSNGLPLLALDHAFRMGISPGIMFGWTIYLIAVEEIHWRVHLGGWLPPGLRAARAYHLAHHDVASGRFNVFFPLFNCLFGNIQPPMEGIVLPPPANVEEPFAWDLGVQETILYTWLIVLGLDHRLLSSRMR
jgi:hypothetical protein